MRRRELGGDHGGQRVVAADADAHEPSPDDDDADNVDRVRLAGDGLAKGRDDDDHELDTICPTRISLLGQFLVYW